MLVHVVDGSSRDPAWDHEVIREELRAHDPALLEKPMLVAFNKIDLPAAARGVAGVPAGARAPRASRPSPSPRRRARGSTRSVPALAELLPPPPSSPNRPSRPASSSTASRRWATASSSSATRTASFRVRGKRIERIAAQTNFDVEESAERFQRDLARLGIDAELRRAGDRAGDLVRIGGDRARVGAAALGGPVTPRRPVAPGALGVFGGTFDPDPRRPPRRRRGGPRRAGPRAGAVHPGRRSRRTSRTGRSRPAEHRLAMVEAAIAGNPAFEVSRIEIDRAGPSYTVDTLEALRAERSRRRLASSRSSSRPRRSPGCRPGTSPSGCSSWRTLVVAPRDGYPDADPRVVAAARSPGSPTGSSFLDGPRLRLSASEIRARAAAGRSMRYLVPDAVAAYIGDHGLYRTDRRTDRS